MGKVKWFPFWYSDFLGSKTVGGMTTEEIGAYMLLLSYAADYDDCGLPDDLSLLSSYAKVSKTKTKRVLDKAFYLKDGKWFNSRLLIEWSKSLKKVQDGEKAARKRWEPK